MKFLLVILILLFFGNACISAASGDLEYLLSREYENAGTWKERVLALLGREVETEDYMRFIEAEKKAEFERRHPPHKRGLIAGSGGDFNQIVFSRKRSPYKCSINFAPFTNADLAGLDYFLKLELVGILCHPENQIPPPERCECLFLLWAEINNEQDRTQKISKQTKQAARSAWGEYTRIRRTSRHAENFQKIKQRYLLTNAKLQRIFAIEKRQGSADFARRMSFRIMMDFYENHTIDPGIFFSFLNNAGFLTKKFYGEKTKESIRLFIESELEKDKAEKLLRYFEEDNARIN